MHFILIIIIVILIISSRRRVARSFGVFWWLGYFVVCCVGMFVGWGCFFGILCC